ncbi:MAG TPA: hypothetical protein VGN12_28990 [Pirellulales bacterium]
MPTTKQGRLLRLAVATVWLAVGLLVTLLLVEWRMRILHPSWLAFIALLLIAAGAAAGAVGLAIWELIRAKRRSATFLWATAALFPLWLFAMPFMAARRQWDERQAPHGAAGQIVIVAAASLMEGQAAYIFPQHLETERLVMFYRDVSRPDADAAAMDQHVAELEKKIGHALRGKVHWVRGSLLGQNKCSFLGLALGSTASPSDWARTEGNLDRHELAHAVITQQRPVTADPPMLLHEGWAESQSGFSSAELAARAFQARELNPGLTVADLLGPDYYYRPLGEVYTYGGALADFLIRRFGVARFVELYNRCQLRTAGEDFEAFLGSPLAEIEAQFWADVAETRGS